MRGTVRLAFSGWSDGEGKKGQGHAAVRAEVDGWTLMTNVCGIK